MQELSTEQAAPPVKRSTRQLLQDHGPAGWLIMRLQRYALLGWVLFFILGFIFSVYVIVMASRPVPVLAVDSGGRVLGSFEYLNGAARSDAEILDGARHWLRYYYSLNGRTIFEDYTAALNMMSEPLRDSKLKDVIDSNYLKEIEQAGARSHLEFEEVTLLERKGHQALVNLRGRLVIDNGQALVDKAFFVQLGIESVSRSQLGLLGTLGLRIHSVVEK